MIHQIINLRGLREQSFVFAFKKNGKRQKGCFTKGCEIYAPISHTLKGEDLSEAIRYEQIKLKEI